MLPSLLVAAAVTAPGAPVPKDTAPNTTGPAPRVVAVKADGSGSVWITAQIAVKQKVQQSFIAVENGKQVVKQQEVEQTVYNYVHKTLGEFGGKFTTADGTTISTEEATKRVKDGATLLVTADGKPVDKSWLRAVNPDAVIMVADGLAHAHFIHDQGYDQGYGALPKTAAPRLALFSTDESGAVMVPTNPNGSNDYQQVYYGDIDGAVVVRRAARVQNGMIMNGANGPMGSADNKKPLADVKFDAYDKDGKLVPRAEALKRLKAGGLVLLAGDSRFPDPNYLKAFRDDVLILASSEFVFPMGLPNPYDMPVKPDPKAKPANAAQPAPAVAPAVAPAAVQLRVAPAVKVVKAAAPAPAPAVEKAADKPADKKADDKDAAKPADKKPDAKPAEKTEAKPAEVPAKPIKP